MMNNNVRNKDGIWVNANVFREEALQFEKHNYYCPYTWGSPAWKTYWLEQKRRCIEGFSSSGVSITGYHYYYLNFVRIRAIDKNSKKKVLRFPDFWDGDYNYFWSLDIAEKGITPQGLKNLQLFVKIDDIYLDGGYHMMVGKSRRKGYSYKNASILSVTYHTIKNSLCLVGSFDKKYSRDAYNKAKSAIDFADANTGFRKQRLIDKKSEHIKSGYLETTTGVGIEKGSLSEIIALTYMDNPDAARGKDADKIILEEMGTFPNAIDAYSATVDSVKDGDIMTGQMIMYGTSSNKEAMTAAFKEMYYDPISYDILPFNDIWDEDSEDVKCGFFHPVYLNKQGYYDEQGNSDIKGAIESENIIREKKKTNSTALNNYVTENPMSPEEAFRSGSINIFPVRELERQLKIVITKKLYLTKGQPVDLRYQNNTVIAKPILDTSKIEPIYFYNQDVSDSKGVVIIYEYPIEDPPFGLYKIGYDPYAQDQSKSTSLGSIQVYKTVEINSYSRNIIVANYIGRPPEADDVNKISLMLAELYNTSVMHENMFIHVKNYFRNKKKLLKLASQPDRVISKNIKETTVSRIYGIHMNEQLKDAGEKYIKDWLVDVRDHDENGDVITNIDYIYDPGLLKELIKYNRKGNFDRVMSLMMLMFQVQEDIEFKYDSKNKVTAITEWAEYVEKLKYTQNG